jgi:hypothetical protein
LHDGSSSPDDASPDDASRDDASRDDASRDDASRDDATRDDATRDDATRDDATHHAHERLGVNLAISINPNLVDRGIRGHAKTTERSGAFVGDGVRRPTA